MLAGALNAESVDESRRSCGHANEQAVAGAGQLLIQLPGACRAIPDAAVTAATSAGRAAALPLLLRRLVLPSSRAASFSTSA